MTEADRDTRLLADLTEGELLAELFPLFSQGEGVRIGPGDDTALVTCSDGAVLVTTDAMVRGLDWRDDWSTGYDVGVKVAAANLADIAAMGGRPTALLVTLVADPGTPVSWVYDLSKGLADEVRYAGASVVGGDLSAAGPGTTVVSVTALGTLGGLPPVRRDGARPGDVVAVAGSLGRSGAGLALLRRGEPERAADLVAYHVRPRPPYRQGPVAAAWGAHAMLDISDGLSTDADRLARAGGVALALDRAPLAVDASALQPALPPDLAWSCVLNGGEEHSLLACFDAVAALPQGWRVIGRVTDGAGVSLGGEPMPARGWDHFAGRADQLTAAPERTNLA